MNFKELLHSIPEVKKEDILSDKTTFEDIEKIHSTLTLDNPLTYIIYMARNKSLTTEERNDIYRIINKLKQNETNAFEASIEKQGMREICLDNNLENIATNLEDLSHDSDLEIELESDSDLDLI